MTPEQDAQFARNTVRSRARPCVQHLLANLHRLALHGPALPAVGVLAGKTAVIVGAGPTLEHALHEMREHRKCLVVFACSQALGALAAANIRPDVLVAIESVDVSAHVAHDFDLGVYDVTTHPALVEAVERHSTARPMWVASSSPESSDLALSLGSQPLRYGPSTTTAAAALAYEWGAADIILVGQPLAYIGERAYATGAGWDGLRVQSTDGFVRTIGREDREEAHARSGVAPVGRLREAVQVPGVDGSTLTTTRDYEAQIEWYARASVRWADRDLCNASGGASIAGWPAHDGHSLLRIAPPFFAAPVSSPTPAADLRAEIAALVASTTEAEQTALAVLDRRPIAPHAARLRYPSLVESWRAPDMIDIRDAVRAGTLTHDTAIERAYEALATAARTVRAGLVEADGRIVR